ncbi:MAG TPA: hypothetical protein VJ697_13155 [Nitrososphaeraceae archaeon]|nr:hypothetical protein [Nitrososphaeraceae archaeon]
MKFDDNPILLDISNSNKRKQKILCVLCKIELDCFNVEENRFRCPRCRNTYQLGFEILPQEDDLISSHEEENEVYGILAAEGNELSPKESDSGKIKRPAYMSDSPTQKVVYYREE